MANMNVSGKIIAGTQQQFFSRNTAMAGWEDGGFNIVLVGNTNMPPSHCSDQGGVPYTTVDKTPIVAEKPYIVKSDDGFSLMVPRVETDKVGPTSDWTNADEIPFSQVYVASDTDNATYINSMLDQGLHLVLQPGIYNLTDSLVIKNPNTVVFGMGLATLVATGGKPPIVVQNVDGVKISGILLQAAQNKSDALLVFGDKDNKYAGNASAPGQLQDVFARVGGPDLDEVETDIMVQINSGNVFTDNMWLWRADHDVQGDVNELRNKVNTSL